MADRKQQRRGPTGRERRRGFPSSRNTSRISPSRIPTRRARSRPSRTPTSICRSTSTPARSAPTDYEVSLLLEGGAGEGDTALFKFELQYAGVFRVENIPAEQIQPLVMIEGPRLLFPFARQIVADAVRSGGYPAALCRPDRLPWPLRAARLEHCRERAGAACQACSLASLFCSVATPERRVAERGDQDARARRVRPR